jgi:hypothetical protein
VTVPRQSACHVSDRDAFNGMCKTGSFFPQYLMRAMLIPARQVTAFCTSLFSSLIAINVSEDKEWCRSRLRSRGGEVVGLGASSQEESARAVLWTLPISWMIQETIG